MEHVEADGDVIVLAAGSIPIGLSVCAGGIIRMRIGLRAPALPASYLPERDFPRGTAHDATTLDAGDLVLRVEPTQLAFHDRAGRALIRLAADEITLEPRAPGAIVERELRRLDTEHEVTGIERRGIMRGAARTIALGQIRCR